MSGSKHRREPPAGDAWDTPDLAVREALLRALREAGRPLELADALRALADGGLEGLARDQGRGVAACLARSLGTPTPEAGAP